MSGTSRKSNRRTSKGSRSAISSPELESGAPPSEEPAGETMSLFGPGAVPANPSHQRERDWERMMFAISGRNGGGSSVEQASAALQSSLANRLRPRTDSLGSTLCKLTWKVRVTPSRRLICALRASALPTGGNGCTSWPSPTANKHSGGTREDFAPVLCEVAQLASWATPQAHDQKGKYRDSEKAIARFLNPQRNNNLTEEVHLASWATPKVQSGDYQYPKGNHGKKVLNLRGQAKLASWATTNAMDTIDRKGNRPSRAATVRKEGYLTEQVPLTAFGEERIGFSAARGTIAVGNGAQLSQAHSRWLMACPPVWEKCCPKLSDWRKWQDFLSSLSSEQRVFDL